MLRSVEWAATATSPSPSPRHGPTVRRPPLSWARTWRRRSRRPLNTPGGSLISRCTPSSNWSSPLMRAPVRPARLSGPSSRRVWPPPFVSARRVKPEHFLQTARRYRHTRTSARGRAAPARRNDQHDGPFAMERITGPASAKALRDALPQAKGAARIGIVNSLGNKADTEATLSSSLWSKTPTR